MTFGNAAIQSIVDELSDELDQDDFAPPPTPQSAAAAAAKARRDEAERKRVERARRREAGVPDQRLVDSLIVTALADAFKAAGAREHMRRTGKLAGLTLDAEAIARAALKGLAGRDIAKDVRWQMIQARLFPPSR